VILLTRTLSISILAAALNLTLDLKMNERVFLHEGEGISCKYTRDQLKCLGQKSGLFIKEMFTNEHAAMVLFCKQ